VSVLNVDYSFSADGDGKEYNVPVSAKYMFFATGTFSSGCLSLEASPDNGVNWFTVDQLSSPGRLIRYLVSGERVRVSLSDAITPTIDAGLRQ